MKWFLVVFVCLSACHYASQEQKNSNRQGD
ncbi:hypothetical protein SAMN04488122_2429 [Chitinophaga arvensicola]|uniref:Uncharacterized protein n=1 Tax=Chitinophaga arvensicola TaxID=29529 RepID=A0A1I0R853_9BACT|nr:hypothetical protein SAMN04488122_2429 [Chitinophaga arvensicola]